MSTNSDEVPVATELRKCENPRCLDGYVDVERGNQEGTESWVDQEPCQICNSQETAGDDQAVEYIALTIYPTHGEVVTRDSPDVPLCRTQTHAQAELIANALNDSAHLRNAIMTHRSQKADDRCIEDDDHLYEALGDGIKCDRRVGDKASMLENCRRFIESRCQGGGWPSYKDLEEQNEKAKRAVVHILKRIKTNEKVRYHLGFGTESFELLTEAAAGLFNEPVEKLAEHYMKAE